MAEPVLLPELEPIETPEGVDWSRIEAEYRAGKPQRQISREFGVSQAAISKRAKRDGWARTVISPGDNRPDNQGDNRKLSPEEGKAILEAFNAGRDCARLAEPADPHREDDDWWRAESNREAILCRQQSNFGPRA
jgi:transposase